MTTTMNPTALFQHYVQNIFKFPKEIKHDIVYCQRALKAHIKVHQMVLDVYKTQLNPDPVQKKRIIDELETQIYEINAEQQFLFLRLRRSIDNFYKALSRKGAQIIPEFMNDLISRELVPLINDQNIQVYPISVRLRCSEEKLIEKYFEVKNENTCNYFEVLDSDEEEERKITAAKSNEVPISSHKNKKRAYVPNTTSSHLNNGDQSQVSLLKPILQRKAHKEKLCPQHQRPSMTPICNETFIDASQFVEVMDGSVSENLKGFRSVSLNGNTTNAAMKRKLDSSAIYPVSIQESKFNKEDLTVSKNVKMSRLNLRQALKKAKTETLAASAKAAANVSPNASQLNSPTAISPDSNSATDLLTSSTTSTTIPINKKLEQRKRTARALAVSAAVSASVMKPIEVSSTSGDSTPERSPTPHQSTSSVPAEFVDLRVKPEDFGQEIFLRMFGLFTPEMRLQMQQRRSKRRRRTVQSNERSDFHYGRIEYGSFPPPEEKKKRKTFLLSPQTKRPKRRSDEKSDDTSSRSSSSSPDEKRGCNECLKSNPCDLERCSECKGFYHQSCHRENDDMNIYNAKKVFSADKAKLCPACKRFRARLKSETEQHRALQTTAKKLEQKMVSEKNRHQNLQKESETFKTQMNTLCKIVRAIKSDPEISSD